MRPVIGLLATIDNDGLHSVVLDYVHSFEKSGAVPVLLPYTDSDEVLSGYIRLCDGFALLGGLDIDPSHYGEEKSAECGEVQHMRDKLELSIMPKILVSGKPLLGICRGAQLINVALGGTLYQDIPSELGESFPHRQTVNKYVHSHPATVIEGTPLFELSGTTNIMINSFHHQAVKKLGQGLAVMATAPDGVIEAFYSTGEQYIRAYQWHPERLYRIDELERNIFIDFINKAKEQKEKEN
ncbi:MAG: gamma-glutamyl-gamma-aminobutyrate hydrolase family protein [Clostridia bacterium]|nr:gamma-glutamyl-gamma-aminobutyrate hydrolase family protein [Clostridia bacterium]